MSDIKTTARVAVTVEVMSSAWGKACTLQQVFDQAAAEALREVQNTAASKGWRVVGKPKVTAVLAGERE
jgi:hypothetical protein